MFHQQNNIEPPNDVFSKKLITQQKALQVLQMCLQGFLYTYKKKRMHYILDIYTIALIYQITIVLNKKRENKILKNQKK